MTVAWVASGPVSGGLRSIDGLVPVDRKTVRRRYLAGTGEVGLRPDPERRLRGGRPGETARTTGPRTRCACYLARRPPGGLGLRQAHHHLQLEAWLLDKKLTAVDAAEPLTRWSLTGRSI